MNYSALLNGRTRSFGLLLLVAFLFLATFAFAQPGGGEALKFQNGNYLDHGDFAYFGNADVLSNGVTNLNKLTVAAWVKWTIDPQDAAYPATNGHEINEGRRATIIAKERYHSRDYGQFWMQHTSSNGQFEFSIRNMTNRYTVSAYAPEQDKWYYVVGVYDGALSSARLKLYINGSLVASANASSGNIYSHTAADRMCIGRSPSGYRLFTGHIDEVRIWRLALTQAQIREQMFMKGSITISPTTNLKAYYNMETVSYGSVANAAGINYHGEYMTGLVDVHSFETTPDHTVTDTDKSWSTSPQTWAPITALISTPPDPDEYADFPKALWTVGGMGVGDSMAIQGNTATTITLMDSDPVNGTPFWSVDPEIDNYGNPSTNNYMTWFGIYDPLETNSRTTSYAPIGTSELNNVTYFNFAGITSSLPASFGSSLLTITGTSVPTDASLVFANDSADVSLISYNVPASTTPPILSRLNRVWRVEVTGAVTATYVFNCHFGYGLHNQIGDWQHLRIIDNPNGAYNFNVATLVAGTYTFTDSMLTVSGVTLDPGVHYITLGSSDAGTPLPVELASFTARVRQSDILLDWETISEKNNYGFNVEKALEHSPQVWTEIGFVEGNGTVDIRKQYRFVDNALPVGKAYYRLKQIDRDGTFAYSDIATVTGSAAPLASLLNTFPNPVRGAATISFVTSRETPVTVTVHNMLGKCVQTLCDNRLFTSGAQSLQLNATGLQPGSYVLQLRTADGTLARPLLIAR
ncbi:MAG: T9SS type A sorting domain-containing protein [Ignavibacteria bacterium]|nr:T9SS type A sorting domain-containing protein [Ignavibacteria bacterium]